jgi:hypothetical protein
MMLRIMHRIVNDLFAKMVSPASEAIFVLVSAESDEFVSASGVIARAEATGLRSVEG